MHPPSVCDSNEQRRCYAGNASASPLKMQNNVPVLILSLNILSINVKTIGMDVFLFSLSWNWRSLSTIYMYCSRPTTTTMKKKTHIGIIVNWWCVQAVSLIPHQRHAWAYLTRIFRQNWWLLESINAMQWITYARARSHIAIFPFLCVVNVCIKNGV